MTQQSRRRRTEQKRSEFRAVLAGCQRYIEDIANSYQFTYEEFSRLKEEVMTSVVSVCCDADWVIETDVLLRLVRIIAQSEASKLIHNRLI